jgi:hypothetical protein
MAFDVYVGTLTRFYTRQWENVVQEQARREGMEYRMVYAGGDSEPPEAEVVLEAVNGWRRAMNQGLAPHGLGPIEWSEDDSQPYFTDRPGWEGYSGLLLWAAYAQTPGQPAPLVLPENWYEDSVYLESMGQEKLRYASVLKANVWLPGDFDFQFKFPYLVGDDDVTVASTGSLLQDLEDLAHNEPIWANRSEARDFIGHGARHVPFEAAAHEGLRVFTTLVEKAVERKLPLVLSF